MYSRWDPIRWQVSLDCRDYCCNHILLYLPPRRGYSSVYNTQPRRPRGYLVPPKLTLYVSVQRLLHPSPLSRSFSRNTGRPKIEGSIVAHSSTSRRSTQFVAGEPHGHFVSIAQAMSWCCTHVYGRSHLLLFLPLPCLHKNGAPHAAAILICRCILHLAAGILHTMLW